MRAGNFSFHGWGGELRERRRAEGEGGGREGGLRGGRGEGRGLRGRERGEG